MLEVLPASTERYMNLREKCGRYWWSTELTVLVEPKGVYEVNPGGALGITVAKKHSEDFYFYVYACVYVSLCMYMCMWVPMEVKKDVRSSEAGIIGGCEFLTWVLGTKLWSRSRAASILTHRVVSLSPKRAL